MADIDKISVNNTTYNIKDSTARESISKFSFSQISSVQFAASSTSDNFWIVLNTTDGRALRVTFRIDGKIDLMKNGTVYATNNA